MYDLCGGCKAFPHRLRASIAAIYVPEFSPFHWLTGEVTDSPPPPTRRRVCADGRCGDLIQSEPLTHVPPHLETLLFYRAPRLCPCRALGERLAQAVHVLLFGFVYLGGRLPP